MKRKYKKIAVLAKSQINNIESIISKAIEESNIPEKHVFINDKLNRYKLKEGIRKKIKSSLSYFERKWLIEYGYMKSVTVFIKKTFSK